KGDTTNAARASSSATWGRCSSGRWFTGPCYEDRSPAAGRVLELVAQAPDRDDALGVRRIRLDLGAQALDVHVEGLGVPDVVVAPHPVDQGVAGQHPTRVLGQQREQLELLERELHLLTANGALAALGVDPTVTDLDHLV